MLPSFFGVVTVLEAYGHAPGSASEIAQIDSSFSTSCLRYWRCAKGIGRSLCLNGFAALVLIVCTTTEVLPKSLGDAANAPRFPFTTFTSRLRTCSGIGSVDTWRSASTFWSFPVCCSPVRFDSNLSGFCSTVSGSSYTVSGLSCTVSGLSSFSIFLYPSASGSCHKISTDFATISTTPLVLINKL